MPTLRNGSRKDSRHIVTYTKYFIKVEIVCTRSAEFQESLLGFVVAWLSAGRESSAVNEFGGLGSLLRAVKRRRSTCGTSSGGGAMTTTMEQMVSQLQQELFTLKAHVAARVQVAAAVQVVNNLTRAQVRRDAPSLICVRRNSLARKRISSRHSSK